MNITGKWIGFFTYGESYDEMQGEKGFFEFNLIDNNGDFTGTCMDVSGFGITVQGFLFKSCSSYKNSHAT